MVRLQVGAMTSIYGSGGQGRHHPSRQARGERAPGRQLGGGGGVEGVAVQAGVGADVEQWVAGLGGDERRAPLQVQPPHAAALCA